jgi:hypothetical protein
MTREEKEAIKGKAIHDAMCSIENRVRHVYNQGYEEGKDYYIQKYGNAYNKGLEDAWECARMIIGLGEPEDVVGCAGLRNFICEYSASEAVIKLKKYEEQQTRKKNDKSCESCRFADLQPHEFPCCTCSQAYMSRWEPQKGTEE